MMDDDEMREYFEECDANGDGSIGFEEFVALMHNLGADMADSEYRIGFGEVDSDGDGSIDFDEFKIWWREH